jgi:regulator of sigma E protease
MSILLFFLVLFALILVHELGHFLVAKRYGIRVDEFGIGFPPKAIGKKYGETEYTLNWLPIGGFVRIFGEDPTDEALRDGPDKNRAFVWKPKWVQALVLVAGVTMNALFAWFLFAIVYMAGMPTAIDPEQITEVRDPQLLVTAVMPESPAADAGLQAGDRIVSIEAPGATLTEPLLPDDVSAFISSRGGEELTFIYRRGGEETTAVVVPRQNVVEDDPTRPAAGFGMVLSGITTLPPHEAIFQAGIRTAEMLWVITVEIFKFFGNAITFNADLSQVAGPVGIVGLVGDASELGLVYLLLFTATISLHLVVINLLPIPALDGGRLLFVFIEAIKGSPIKPAVAILANRIGFALLILLMIAVTFNDVLRIFG